MDKLKLKPKPDSTELLCREMQPNGIILCIHDKRDPVYASGYGSVMEFFGFSKQQLTIEFSHKSIEGKFSTFGDDRFEVALKLIQKIKLL